MFDGVSPLPYSAKLLNVLYPTCFADSKRQHRSTNMIKTGARATARAPIQEEVENYEFIKY